jgi:Tol biopolymer transport system component
MRRRTILIALPALAAAVAAVTAAGAPTKERNGKISFWSDRAFGGRAQVFVMNSDGSRQRRVTKLFSAKRGSWSPDGRKLVIDGRDHDTLFDFDVFVMNADGSALRKVSSGPERDTQAQWSPDGRLISFVRDTESGGAPEVWIVGEDGNDSHRVAQGGPAVWSPKGTKLAVGGFGLRIMSIDGTSPRTIVPGESEPAAWSADGRRLLFSSWKNGNPDVYVVNTDGKRLRRLTRCACEDLAADFSPDGRKILFSSDRAGLRQVYTMNLDGSGVRNLTRSRSNEWATSWQSLP